MNQDALHILRYYIYYNIASKTRSATSLKSKRHSYTSMISRTLGRQSLEASRIVIGIHYL